MRQGVNPGIVCPRHPRIRSTAPRLESAGSGETRAIGTRWLLDGSSAVLRVPSIVVPRESNYMLNPAHPRFPEIEIGKPMAFEFDVRLLARIQ